MATNELPVLNEAGDGAGSGPGANRRAAEESADGEVRGGGPDSGGDGGGSAGDGARSRLGRGPIGTVIGPTERSGGSGAPVRTSAEVLAQAAEEAGVSPEPTIPEDAPENVRPLWAALCEVRDPELPVSLVDLGLIYGIRREGGRMEVEMTFTAMGCPCMMVMEMDVRDRLLEVDGVEDVQIDIVWDPPWTRKQMSEKAKKILRCYGVAA